MKHENILLIHKMNGIERIIHKYKWAIESVDITSISTDNGSYVSYQLCSVSLYQKSIIKWSVTDSAVQTTIKFN